MKILHAVGLGILVVSASSVPAQEFGINRDNRSISVTVTQKLEVDPDIAQITFGSQTYGATHDAAYLENLRIAEQIVKALLDSGVPRERIESHNLSLDLQDESDQKSLTAEQRSQRRYMAHQSWTVRVAVGDAQKIVDIAVHAGANQVEDVTWDVSDPDALDARARRAALEKARTTAEEIANGFHGKLGQLLYASNSSDSELLYVPGSGFSDLSVKDKFIEKFWQKRNLQLFPKKITREAEVHAVFALE
ncbi:MAG TPA: SIMPL domain-containing protein [Candidatus Limnocylindrales bacterium]|nr:SIMPL domain-containing protein [Candidatus Limnocylindrales bacterium]